MRVINAVNVNDAYRMGLELISHHGMTMDSRNGPVLRVPEPVSTRYDRPEQRVLFDAQRDAHPFFHLFEALWILGGRRDLQTLAHFLPRFKDFSDDGIVLHGAYGYRLRHYPLRPTPDSFSPIEEFDQLEWAAQRLRANPTDRRVVLSIWDPAQDALMESKDIPCNDMIKLTIVDDQLDMIVFNRSNDAIWGAYGANAVHFSMIHEYLAAMIEVGLGHYYQISTDLHAYMETPYRFTDFWPMRDYVIDPYNIVSQPLGLAIHAHPLVDDPGSFDDELNQLLNWLNLGILHVQEFTSFKNSFFREVALPMYRAFREHRIEHNTEAAIAILVNSPIDWHVAGCLWLQRRLAKSGHLSY